MSAAASRNIKQYMVQPKVAAPLGAFVAVNETPASHMRASVLSQRGVQMHPKVLPFDRKVRMRRKAHLCIGCAAVQLSVVCRAAGRSLRKVFRGFHQAADRQAGALLLGLEMTVFDVPSTNSESAATVAK